MSYNLHRNQEDRINKIRSFRLPEESDPPEYWQKFMAEENKTVEQNEIDTIKRALKLYEISLSNPKYTFEQKKNIVALKCEQIYILANLEIRQERQKKVFKIMDGMDFKKIAKDLLKAGVKFE
tara:strand:- start:1359 stop:1727 length:369 start_codon:yes stop_codon:yes gene_type:complete